MAVYDRWHKAPGPDDEPCREHGGRGRARVYPSAVHGQGDRWQVRWYNEEGKQRKKGFKLREGRNPDLHADAWNAKVTRDLHTGDYIDPDDADVTLQRYAEQWRATRTHDTVTADKVEQRLRLHVYPGPATPGRTPRGGVAIGHRRMRELARRPSLVAAWIAAMPLRDSSARLVVSDVSAIFRAAVDDGIVGRDPTRAASVDRPGRSGGKAVPWALERVEGMSAALPAHLAVVPYLGAATGMRQGELFGLAAGDVVFLGRDPRVKVTRQVKLVRGRPFFAPLKNRKPHEVPLAPSLAPRLAEHMRQFPPVPVTLDWHDPRDRELHGKPVTVSLVLTDGRGRALSRPRFNEQWHAAQEKAGVTPERDPGVKRAAARGDGCHALRHTAASVWLRAGIDVVRVAAWLGDTPQVVLQTYAHLMPGDSGDDGRAATDAFFSGPGAPEMPYEDRERALCLVNAMAVDFRQQ